MTERGSGERASVVQHICSEFGELRTDVADYRGVGVIDQGAGIIELFVSDAHGVLFGDDVNTDVAQDEAQKRQATKAPERAGGGCHDAGGLAAKAFEG